MKKQILPIIAIFLFSNILPLFAEDPDTLIRDGYDKTEMDSSIAKARNEVDQFITALLANDGDHFSVKAPITQNGDTEHFWLTDIKFKKNKFTGLIGNEPGTITNVKINQKWKIKKDDISDWMIVRNGRIHGGYTIDPLLATMPEEEAESWRKKLVR